MKLKLSLLLLVLAGTTHAIDFIQTSQFVETNTLSRETWISAQNVSISGTASNDLFASAQVIDLSGTFEGDVWAIGSTISSGGTLRDDARFLGTTIQLSGTQHGTVAAMGNTIKLDRTAVLHNDLYCLGENVIIEGSIAGDVRIMAQRATLGGTIDGDISIYAQDIVVLPGTVLKGDLTYTAPNELILSQSVIHDGELNRTILEAPAKTLLKSNLGLHFMFGFGALIAGIAFMRLFPHYTGASLHTLRHSRGLCSLAGFAALFLMPMVACILFFTLIGTPLSLLIFGLYCILLYLSKIVVALWIGTLILKTKNLNKSNATAPLALGLLLLYSLTSFPALSLGINTVICLFGLGALILALFKKPVFVIQKPTETNKTQQEI